MFQALSRDRLERLNASPSATPWAYFRVYSVLLLVLSVDFLWYYLIPLSHSLSNLGSKDFSSFTDDCVLRKCIVHVYNHNVLDNFIYNKMVSEFAGYV